MLLTNRENSVLTSIRVLPRRSEAVVLIGGRRGSATWRIEMRKSPRIVPGAPAIPIGRAVAGPAEVGQVAADRDGAEAPAFTALVSGYASGHGLSDRETIVLLLGAQGLHRKAVASRLGCSPGTVDTYWRRILRKTGLSCQSAVNAALLSMAVQTSRAADHNLSNVTRHEKQDKTPHGGRSI
jgi:DNA-binding CsgD family transcriptional regulator